VPEGWLSTGIPGVLLRALTVHPDSRGSFMEVWRASWTDPLGSGFRQANLSRSQSQVLRGMHFHERQDDWWVVLEGRAFVACVDLRSMIAGRATRPATDTFEVGVGSALLIPAGVAHGFLALEPMALGYLVTAEHDGTDEHGFVWNDVKAAIPWPVDSPILSGRDQANPSLDDAIAAARQRSGHVAAR